MTDPSGSTTRPDPETSVPILDLRVRWRAGQVALVLAAALTVVACFRPLSPGASVPLRLAVTLALGLGVATTALLASLRGRGRAEQWAFYVFLVLSLDALGQTLQPFGWPGWPLMVLLLGAAAVAEPLPLALGLAALVSLLTCADAVHSFVTWPEAAAAVLGYAALVVAVSRALRGEKHRLAAALGELARLRHGIDHLDEVEPSAASLRPTTADLSLRQISEDGRKARHAERAEEVDESLAQIVALAHAAVGAHAVLYFDVDRQREAAFLRAAEGPSTIVRDSIVPLSQDPFAFVLDRGQSFYATDFPRLLEALPYYRRNVKIGTLLALPVKLGGAVSGLLIADQLEIQSFTSHEPELLESFAEMASRTIQRARESGSREDMGTEFKAVYAVSRNLARLAETQPLRRLLIRSARDMVPTVEAAAVVMTDESQTRYLVEADGFGWPREFEHREVGLSERTWAAWVLRSAEDPYLLDNVAGHKDRMPILVLDEGGGRAESLVAVPLRAGDRSLGALVLTGKRGTFDANLLRVLGILANQAAAALATIQLVDRNKQLAIRDGLTRLYNRRAFDEALARSIAQSDRQGGSFSVLLLDIDHFKKLNDTFGHQAGDAALRNTAGILQKHLRKGDLAARYGGEEFVGILPGAEEPGALQLAERIRAAIQDARFVFEGAKIRLTASFGLAVWSRDGRDAEALLASADRAMYAAKEGGRNRVLTASRVASSPDAP